MPLTEQYQQDIAAGARDPADLDAAIMIDRDRASWEQALREYAAAAGVAYDPTDLEGIVRNASYASNAGMDPLAFLNHQRSIYDVRASNTPGVDTPYPMAPRGVQFQNTAQTGIGPPNVPRLPYPGSMRPIGAAQIPPPGPPPPPTGGGTYPPTSPPRNPPPPPDEEWPCDGPGPGRSSVGRRDPTIEALQALMDAYSRQTRGPVNPSGLEGLIAPLAQQFGRGR